MGLCTCALHRPLVYVIPMSNYGFTLHRVPPACMSAENQATPSLIYYSNLSCISFVNPSRPPPFILCCCLALMQCTWSQHDPKWLVPFFKARTVSRASNDRYCLSSYPFSLMFDRSKNGYTSHLKKVIKWPQFLKNKFNLEK